MSPTPAHGEVAADEASSEREPFLVRVDHNTNVKNNPKSTAWLLWKLFAIVFLVNVAYQVLAPAQTQIYESIYCSQWYKQHPVAGIPDAHGNIPEAHCKLAPIQTQISTLRGWLEFFTAAPGLILSIPMGILADKIGRRHLIIFNLIALSLAQLWTTFVTWYGGQIPLRAIWLGAGLGVFSGGTIVTELLYICILTDLSPSDKVAETFFRSNAFNAFSKVIGPFLAGSLMRVDPWLAIYLGLALLLMTVLLATTVPETLHWQRSVPDNSTQDGDNPGDRAPSPEAQRPRLLEVQRLIKVWSDWRLLFVALTYPFRLICTALNDLLQRYVSNRYGWTLANATLIYSLQAIFAGFVFITLLPYISGLIDRRFGFSVIQRNVVLSRVALFLMVVAYAVIGLAPTASVMVIGLLIETLSGGFPATLRAIATAVVDDDDRGRLFSVLAIAETLSTMMAYPVTATLFNIGIEKGGGPWLGLPYDLISVIAAMGFIVMCLARFERPMRL